MPGSVSDAGGFAWTVETQGTTARVTLRGELDLNQEDAFRTELEKLQSDVDCVELDLSELSFIDSSGIRLLLRAATHPTKPSGQVVLTAVSEPVKRTMNSLGLLDFFQTPGR